MKQHSIEMQMCLYLKKKKKTRKKQCYKETGFYVFIAFYWTFFSPQNAHSINLNINKNIMNISTNISKYTISKILVFHY